MIERELQQELLDHMSRLPSDKQRRVVEFAAALSYTTEQGVPASKLLELAGTLPSEDADEMRRAVEEDCEQIDRNGW
jgi:hypothetical protein